MTKHQEKVIEYCPLNCGRVWDEEGGENGFDDCVSAYHKKTEPKKEIPMGVSQWKEHGIKHGYWKFFEESQSSELKREIEKEIGMVRQWLNENRITDPKKMVTNEEIRIWFKEILKILK